MSGADDEIGTHWFRNLGFPRTLTKTLLWGEGTGMALCVCECIVCLYVYVFTVVGALANASLGQN